jgi:gamma-glutamylputrescine oxidase
MTVSAYYQSADQNGARQTYPQLHGQIEAKVCVIGGGFAGLHTALSLSERGVKDVVLLEAEHVGFGASGRNGGFVFGGYSLGEAQLLRALGPEAAKRWYLKTQAAVVRIRALIARYQIDCDCVDEGVLWVNWFADSAAMQARQQLLANSFDTHWQPWSRAKVHDAIASKRYSSALFERNALHLNPLKLARGLARAACSNGAQIFERSPVQSIAKAGHGGQQWRVESANGAVLAEHVVVAGGGYLQGNSGNLKALKRALLPIATYVLATEPLGANAAQMINTKAAIYDSRFAFDYYRLAPDTRLIWGGRISILDRSPAQVSQLLRRDILRVFPQFESLCEIPSAARINALGAGIEFAWSGLMSYARHEMPQIGRLEPGFWYAQAFGGHGLAPTCVAGETLAAAIADNCHEYQDLACFGLVPTYGAAGKLAAQLNYTWLQWQDKWRARIQLSDA